MLHIFHFHENKFCHDYLGIAPRTNVEAVSGSHHNIWSCSGQDLHIYPAWDEGTGNTAVRPGADNYQTVHADSISAMLAQNFCSHYQEFTKDLKAGDYD